MKIMTIGDSWLKVVAGVSKIKHKTRRLDMRDLDDKTKVMELLNARAAKIVSLQEEIDAAKSVIYNLIQPVWTSPEEKEKWIEFKERALKYAYSKQSPFDRLDSVPTYTC